MRDQAVDPGPLPAPRLPSPGRSAPSKRRRSPPSCAIGRSSSPCSPSCAARSMPTSAPGPLSCSTSAPTPRKGTPPSSPASTAACRSRMRWLGTNAWSGCGGWNRWPDPTLRCTSTCSAGEWVRVARLSPRRWRVADGCGRRRPAALGDQPRLLCGPRDREGTPRSARMGGRTRQRPPPGLAGVPLRTARRLPRNRASRVHPTRYPESRGRHPSLEETRRPWCRRDQSGRLDRSRDSTPRPPR